MTLSICDAQSPLFLLVRSVPRGIPVAGSLTRPANPVRVLRFHVLPLVLEGGHYSSEDTKYTSYLIESLQSF